MNTFKVSVILLSLAVLLLLTSFSAYIWSDTDMVAMLAMGAAAAGFLGFVLACRHYDER
ncbi:MAG: hypothetical protein ACI4I4_01290 [Acutalibacteraceae bacterium]